LIMLKNTMVTGSKCPSCEKEIDFGKVSFKILKIIEPLKKTPTKTF